METPPHLTITASDALTGHDVFIRVNSVEVCARTGRSLHFKMASGETHTVECHTIEFAAETFAGFVKLAVGIEVKR